MSVDAYKDVTISLKAVAEEPKASIVSIEAPSEAAAGDKLTLRMMIKNIGGSGVIFGRIKDLDTGDIVGPIQSTVLASGDTVKFSWYNVVMPNRDFKLRFEAGHIVTA